LLIQNKANVNVRDKLRVTQLHVACEVGSLESVKALVENRADLNATTILRETPLDKAIDKSSCTQKNQIDNHVAIVNYLQENGAKRNSRYDPDETQDDKRKRVLLKWMNCHLNKKNLKITNVEDIVEGITFWYLLSIIFDVPIPKDVVLSPVLRDEKIKNMSKAIMFMRSHIAISGEDDQDMFGKIERFAKKVVNGDKKSLLSLLSTLANQGTTKAQVEFIEWLNKVGIPCNNLTTEWKDGKNLCKLLNLLQRGIFQPTNNAYQTLCTVMEITKYNFGIPQLLYPSDFQSETDPGVSLMYLNCFKTKYEELKK